MNRESADRASRAVDDPEGPAVGAQVGVLCSKAHRVMKRSASNQRQRPIVADHVSRNAGRRSVDREQVPAVMADLHPTWRCLLVREGRGSDRGQRAVVGDPKRRDGAGVSGSVGVGDVQLAGVRRPKLAAERAGSLRGEWGARSRGEAAIATDAKAVDQRAADARPDEVRSD
jgi:hypothetical protein